MKSLLLALTLIFSIQTVNADTITGRVVGVADGDTITLLDQNHTQYKVRLAGIDAPEKRQAFGNVSKKSLSDLVFDKQVTVDWKKLDRYGRTVGKVLLNGQDINLEQIKRGMAWYFKKYKGELVQEDRISYVQAQQDAEKNRIGLWKDASPIAPWDFRKQKNSE